MFSLSVRVGRAVVLYRTNEIVKQCCAMLHIYTCAATVKEKGLYTNFNNYITGVIRIGKHGVWMIVNYAAEFNGK